MKAIYYLFILSICTAIGCASLQKPVDEVYLTEADQQEKDTLSSIEKSIIEKKVEKDNAETVVAVSTQTADVSKAEITVLDAQKEVLLKKEKFATLVNSAEQKVIIKQQLSANDLLKKKEDARFSYCLAKIDSDQASFKVKESELGVLVARLDFEKSKIARKYQIKRLGEKSKDLIDPAKFEEYLKKQEDTLSNEKQNLIKMNDLLSKADENQKKIQGVSK
jgi:hypothetical protein